MPNGPKRLWAPARSPRATISVTGGADPSVNMIKSRASNGFLAPGYKLLRHKKSVKDKKSNLRASFNEMGAVFFEDYSLQLSHFSVHFLEIKNRNKVKGI
jgi:hypothetical protein